MPREKAAMSPFLGLLLLFCVCQGSYDRTGNNQKFAFEWQQWSLKFQLLARLEDEYLSKGFPKFYRQLIYMGKTLLILPKNRVNYQPLFEKARGKRAFPKKASQ